MNVRSFDSFMMVDQDEKGLCTTLGPDLGDVSRSVSGEVSLTLLATRGILWNLLGGVVVRQTAVVLSGIVLARLLELTDFSLIALALAIFGAVDAFSCQGFAWALVREPTLDRRKCNSVFWLLVAVASVLAGLLITAAPLLARFFDQPALPTVLTFLALILFVNIAGAVPQAILNHDMRFREKNILNMVGVVISAILAIGIALGGGAYWAQIASYSGWLLTLNIGAFVVSKYVPRLEFSWCEIKATARFGVSMLGTTIVEYLNTQGEYLFMGRFWGQDVQLGIYSFAKDRSKQPFVVVMSQIFPVAFPAFSRIQHDLHRIRHAYLRGTRLLALLALPGYVVVIGLADPVLLWIFGWKWMPAVPLFQLFAVFCFVWTFSELTTPSLLAMGHARAYLVYNVSRLTVVLPVLLLLLIYDARIGVVAWSQVVIGVLMTPFYIGFFYRKIGLSPQMFIREFGRVILAAMVMGVVMASTKMAGQWARWPDWLVVMGAATLSTATFVLVERAAIAEMVAVMRGVWNRQ